MGKKQENELDFGLRFSLCSHLEPNNGYVIGSEKEETLNFKQQSGCNLKVSKCGTMTWIINECQAS
mgnify:CR=1 FL=1